MMSQTVQIRDMTALKYLHKWASVSCPVCVHTLGLYRVDVFLFRRIHDEYRRVITECIVDVGACIANFY